MKCKNLSKVLQAFSNQRQEIKSTNSGYIYGEMIGGSDPNEDDSIYLAENFQLGFFLQNPGINYPPHAHDSEEVIYSKVYRFLY